MNSKVWNAPKPPFIKYKKSMFLNASKVTGLVYQIGESEILRKPSVEVSLRNIKTREMQLKFAFLKKRLQQYTKITGHGRGMAAVQVGIPENFFVAYTNLEKTKIETFINPKITKKSAKHLKYPEMCMSANPVIVPLTRPAWIEFDYLEESGNSKHWSMKDETKLGRMLNRVFQHEIDHLAGIINIDLVSSPKELILESNPSFYKKSKFETV
ncbi:MAG TPA: peptide deformylase [Candidatus Saccharimonadales bacterium]|nr:peptide deformylase [Candidatus Saccharimonadales bacterium]